MADNEYGIERLLCESHEAALEVLREREEEYVPFAVYLRKFDIHNLHGPSDNARQLGEDSLLDALPESARLLTIQEEPQGQLIRSTFSRRVPALRLGEGDNWKSVLRPILARADLIISEFVFLADGVRWELETCRELGKHHQTVLVLPPRSCPFECLDHLGPIDQFPRVIWADQLFHECIAESFVIRDLVARIEAIGACTKEVRKRLYEQGLMFHHFPITYEGVVSGYKERAQDWQARAALAEPDHHEDIDYYRFWDHFRTASVLGVLVNESQSLSLEEAAPDLALAYIEVLQGIAHGVVSLDQEGSFLTRDFARGIADSLHPLISVIPEGTDSWLRRYADITLERLGYSVINE